MPEADHPRSTHLKLVHPSSDDSTQVKQQKPFRLTQCQQIEMLSFVRTKPKRGTGRDWWVVPDMPNYSMECRLGEALGCEFVAFLRSFPSTDAIARSTMSNIVQDMISLGKWSGTEMMFVQTVARAAAAGGGQ